MALKADPPYVIRTERLLLRCWEPADAPALDEAIRSSLEHLRAWMPWAHAEPVPLAEKVQLLRAFRGRFDLGQEFVYGVFEPDTGRVLGGSGLHPRSDEGSLEIGYWIRSDAVGRGYATETAGALARVAIELCGAHRVDIVVEPGNEPSLAIPRKLGFSEEAVLRRRLSTADPAAPKRDAVVFTLLAEDLATSLVRAAAYEAWDAAGGAIVRS